MMETQESRLLVPRKKRPAVNSSITNEAGMTYVQILKDLRQNVKPDKVDITIHIVRKTANGNVLLAFKSSTTDGKAFQKAVQRFFKETGKVLLRMLEVPDLEETRPVSGTAVLVIAYVVPIDLFASSGSVRTTRREKSGKNAPSRRHAKAPSPRGNNDGWKR